MPTYPNTVEQWRPIVEQYFRPEDVDKALWVIMHESGGRPDVSGDGGHAIGLFQHNTGGLASGRSLEALKDPVANIKLAAEAVYGGQGWKPWGENNTYQGKPFGALGSFPYPDTAAGNIESNTLKPVQPGGTKMPGPQGLPEGTQPISDNLARWLDPATGEYVYFKYNPQESINLFTGERIPPGWAAVGTLPQPNAQRTTAEAAKNIRINSTTGKAYVVDNQGNIVRPAPEFDEKPKAESGKQLSGAGLARLYGAQQGQGLTTGGTLSSSSPPAGVPAPQSGASANPQQRILSQSAIESDPGLTLGAAEPYMTGLKSPLPLNLGGVYEGGGMAYIPGTGMGSTTQFSGRVPGEGGLPERSVGFGFNAMDMPEIKALGNVKPENMSDVALNLMSMRQKAQDTGLNFPDLESIKNRESQGYAPKGSYKEALASLGKAVGSPLSALDFLMMPDVQPLARDEDPYNRFQAEGGSNVAGLDEDQRNRIQGYFPGGIGNGFTTNEPVAMMGMQTGQPLAIAGEAGPEAIDVKPLGPRPEFGMAPEEVAAQRRSEGLGAWGSRMPAPAPTRMERFAMDPAIARVSQATGTAQDWYGAQPSVSRQMAYTPGMAFNMEKAKNLASSILGYSTANSGGAYSQLVNSLMERPEMWDNVGGFRFGGMPAQMADGGTGYAGLGGNSTAMLPGAASAMAPPPPPKTPFAQLLETLMMPRNRGDRNPPLKPVGSTMLGAA